MAKITIDGKDFEVSKEFIETLKNTAIEPVEPEEEPEEKRTQYMLVFYNHHNDEELIDQEYDFTEAEAQAVSEAIQALLEYVNTPSDEPIPGEPDYILKALKARDLLQGGR